MSYEELNFELITAISAEKLSVSQIQAKYTLGPQEARTLQLLARGHALTAQVETADGGDRSGTQYTIEGKSYTFNWPKSRQTRPTTIDSVQLQAMLLQYSHHGFAETAAQVASMNGLQRWQVRAMFGALGVVKEGVPCTPEAVTDALDNGLMDELEDRLAAFATAKLEKRLRARQVREIEKDAARWKDSGKAIAEIIKEACGKVATEIALSAFAQPALTEGPCDRGSLAIFINDWHFGAYATKRINGDSDYNRRIAIDVLRSAIHDLVAKFPGRPKSILLALNGDLCHIDTMSAATTKGTSQDCDGVPAEIFDEFVTFMLGLPTEVLKYTDSVVVAILPGNHDEAITTGVNAAVRFVYSDHPSVKVHQGSLSQTQHILFEKAYVALHHGHSRQSNPKSAAAVMAQDVSGLWSKTQYRYYVKGHTHHQTAKEEHGILHVTATALVPADVYHNTHWNGRFNPSLTGLWLAPDGSLNGILHGRPKMKLYRSKN